MIKTENQFAVWDIILLALASIFTVLVIRVCLYRPGDTETIGKNLLSLSLSVCCTIFAFQHKALRKQKVFVAWTILSLVMLGMFFWLYKNATLNYLDKDNLGLHNYANGLKVPFILLLLFWICRKLSSRYYGTELLLLNSGFDGIDYIEKRKYNLMDYVWMTASVIIILLGHLY